MTVRRKLIASFQYSDRLTSGKLLASNVSWNLLGQCAPIAVAIITIPLIIKGMGTERYGMLTLAWMVLGYFSLFDMGLGRALTKLVAEKIGADQTECLHGLIWTALVLMLILGLFGSSILALISPWLAYSVLKIPAALKAECLNTFYLLSLSIPFVILTTALRGVLEAQQRFKLVNIVNTPLGIFTYAGPLIALHYTTNLFWVVAILLVGRIFALTTYFVLCTVTIPELIREFSFQRSMIRPLISFGSWMTISNIISPFMVTLDRFLIGALLSVTAVAYYSAPFDLVMRILIIPAAVTGVLFPAFATCYVQNREKTKLLYRQGMKYLIRILLPITLLIIVFARYGLNLWLGAEFAQHSTRVLQWLALGVLFNGMARFPFSLLQGVGRPDITAKIHLLEFPVYIVLVWSCINMFGIDGAGVAWMLRAFIDLFLLVVMTSKSLRL